MNGRGTWFSLVRYWKSLEYELCLEPTGTLKYGRADGNGKERTRGRGV